MSMVDLHIRTYLHIGTHDRVQAPVALENRYISQMSKLNITVLQACFFCKSALNRFLGGFHLT